MINKLNLDSIKFAVKLPSLDKDFVFDTESDVGCVFSVEEVGVNFMTMQKLFDKSELTEYFNYDGQNKNFEIFGTFGIGNIVFNLQTGKFGKVVDNSKTPTEVTVLSENGQLYDSDFSNLKKVFDAEIISKYSAEIKAGVESGIEPSADIKVEPETTNIQPQEGNNLNINLNLSPSVKSYLRKIIRENGIQLCDDRYMMENLLKNCLHECDREINLILTSCRAQIPQKIYSLQPEPLAIDIKNSLILNMCNNFFISKDAAIWAIDAWVDIITKLNNYERETKVIATPEGKYIGEIEDDTFTGYGVFKWPNGDVYLGEWLNGVKSGLGIWQYQNGDKFLGEFEDDQTNGHGILITSTGEKYEGTWKNGTLLK